MDFSKLFDALKLGPRVLIGIVIATGTLTLAPPIWLAQLGLADILKSYRGWFGAVLVISSALLISHVAVASWKSARGAWNKRATLRGLHKQMKSLSPSEKRVLAAYLSSDTTTVYFSISNGVVTGLISKGILYRASNIAASFDRFPFNLQGWAWAYLKEHPDILASVPVSTDAAAGD